MTRLLTGIINKLLEIMINSGRDLRSNVLEIRLVLAFTELVAIISLYNIRKLIFLMRELCCVRLKCDEIIQIYFAT